MGKHYLCSAPSWQGGISVYKEDLADSTNQSSN